MSRTFRIAHFPELCTGLPVDPASDVIIESIEIRFNSEEERRLLEMEMPKLDTDRKYRNKTLQEQKVMLEAMLEVARMGHELSPIMGRTVRIEPRLDPGSDWWDADRFGLVGWHISRLEREQPELTLKGIDSELKRLDLEPSIDHEESTLYPGQSKANVAYRQHNEKFRKWIEEGILK